MEIKAGRHFMCLRPPMKNFTKGKDYGVYESEYGYLAVREDSGTELDAEVWLTPAHFRDVTALYENPSIKMELLPFIWETKGVDEVAVGLNHTYTVFESDEGIGVKWHNILDDSGDTGYGFGSIEAAKEWVEKTHHPAQLPSWVRFIKGFRHEPTKEVSDSIPTEP